MQVDDTCIILFPFQQSITCGRPSQPFQQHPHRLYMAARAAHRKFASEAGGIRVVQVVQVQDDRQTGVVPSINARSDRSSNQLFTRNSNSGGRSSSARSPPVLHMIVGLQFTVVYTAISVSPSPAFCVICSICAHVVLKFMVKYCFISQQAKALPCDIPNNTY